MAREHRRRLRSWLRPWAWTTRLWAAASVAVLAGCPAYGIVDDGTSVSWGATNRGALIRPARLPARGDGYAIGARWRRRGLSWGTDEMVALIAHLGRRIQRALPGTVLSVGDLSPHHGGPSAWHRSHQTGRDADLLLLATDAGGKPIRLDQMVRFRADGTAALPAGKAEASARDGAGDGTRDGTGDETRDGNRPPVVVRFDVARNWRLVRELVENPLAQVQYIFLYEPLRQLLLDYASAVGEPYAVVLRASRLLLQPGDSLPHDDHMHVRLFCAHSDRALGCVDRGRIRWVKKLYKYAAWRRAAPVRGAWAAPWTAPWAPPATAPWAPPAATGELAGSERVAWWRGAPSR